MAAVCPNYHTQGDEKRTQQTCLSDELDRSERVASGLQQQPLLLDKILLNIQRRVRGDVLGVKRMSE